VNEEKKLEEKVVRTYKYELLSLKDLPRNTLLNIACQGGLDVPPIEDKFGNKLNTSVTKVPNLFLLTQITDYNGFLYLQMSNYVKRYAPFTCYVPTDYRVAQLVGTQGKAMLKAYEEHRLKNLNQEMMSRISTIGSDPELFIVDSKNQIIPAFDFLPSKAKKHLYDGVHGIYWDGFQAEFDTSAPGCLAQHLSGVYTAMRALLTQARVHDKKARISIQNTLPVAAEVLAKAKQIHVEFGCLPSLNVYGMQSDKNNSPRELPWRFAGGHIHLGIGKQSEVLAVPIVKTLDAILGIACVSLFAKIDNPLRRQHYGMAGEYRLPKHGIEYRVLSNAWLCHPLISNLVVELARKCVIFSQKGFSNLWKVDEKEVIRIINECDVASARKVLKDNRDIFEQLYKACFSYGNMKDIFNIFMNGVEDVVQDYTDVDGNWGLSKGVYQAMPWQQSYEVVAKGKKL
jgi:hypothetical protein